MSNCPIKTASLKVMRNELNLSEGLRNAKEKLSLFLATPPLFRIHIFIGDTFVHPTLP